MIKLPFNRRILGLYLGSFAVAVNFLFSLSPHGSDILYQRGIFVLVRLIWDFTIGLLPFPTLYLLLAVFGIIIYRKVKMRPVRKSGIEKVFTAFNSLGWLVFLFYFLWGFNYASTPLKSRLSANFLEQNPINLESFTKLVAQECEDLWVDQSGAGWTENELRANVERTLDQYDYNTWGRVRCRVIHNHGVMRRMGILGIYLPFVSEGHADGSQSDFGLPFTCAHEMSHGYGITDEGEANFVAWLSMHESENPWLKYASSVQLLRSCLVQLRSESQEAYSSLRKSLHPKVGQDLDFINENVRAYPPFFADFSDRVNDLYLKSQGIEEGTKSYGTFVELAFLWMNLAPKSN